VRYAASQTTMSLKIIASTCTGCSACEPECPNVAIYEKSGTFDIDPAKCTECEGHYDEEQCLAVCPVDGCIVPL
jgi:ferredoxin